MVMIGEMRVEQEAFYLAASVMTSSKRQKRAMTGDDALVTLTAKAQ